MAETSLETWTWFLISRPILSISASDVSTRPYGNSLASHWSVSNSSSQASTEYHEGFYVEPEPAFTTNMGPPPNFPRPIPTSFVVFACPSTNLTQYDEITETMAPTPANTPFSRNNIPGVPGTGGKKIYKRKDYDLSHQGVPLFEFGGTKFVSSNTCGQFLSVEALGPWYDNDPYLLINPEAYQYLKTNWLESIAEDVQDECEELVGEGRQRFIRNYMNEPPAPFEGIWWERFYRGIYEDCERWRSVRRAMALGKLRVIVRYTEYEAAYPVPKDLNQDAEMSGTGFYGGLYGAIGGDRKGKGKVMPDNYPTQRGQGQGEQRKPSNLSTTFNNTSIDTDGDESGACMDTQMELYDEK